VILKRIFGFTGCLDGEKMKESEGNERKEDTRGCLMERRGSYGEEEILLADGCVA